MGIIIFGTTKEEKILINKLNNKYNINPIKFVDGILSFDRISLVEGFDTVWIMTNSYIGEKEAEALRKAGVRYIVSRATGIDHLDKKALRKNGIKAANVPSYSPNAISEHTVLLALTAARKMKKSQQMVRNYDYTIEGICGREIRTMKVGVFGAGRIGRLTIKALAGLGAEVLVCNRSERKDLLPYASYVSKKEIFELSDMIILHCPLLDDNYHLINDDSLGKCKDGLILVNTARGGLVNSKSVLRALESGKMSSFAFDVYEGEDEFIRHNFRGKEVMDDTFVNLCKRDDVIYTPHISFYTNQAVHEILRITLENAKEYMDTGTCDNEITL